LLACALGGLAAAPVAHRLWPRALALVGFAGFIAGNAAATLSLNPWLNAGFLAVAGLAAGAAAAASARLMSTSPRPENLAAQIGIFTAGVLIVFGGGGAWATAEFGRVGLHGSMVIIAALLAPLALTLPERGTANVAPPSAARRPMNWAVAALLLGVLLYAAKDGAAWSMGQVVADGKGFGAGGKALLLGGAGVSSILGAALAVWSSRRGRWLLPAVIGLTLNTVLGSMQFLVPGMAPFVIAQLTYSGSHLFIVPFMLGLAAHIDPRGRLVAATGAVLAFGAAVGPLVGAAIFETMGGFGLAAGMAAFTVAAVLLWTPAVCVRLLGAPVALRPAP
jgi:hypothetical protein